MVSEGCRQQPGRGERAELSLVWLLRLSRMAVRAGRESCCVFIRDIVPPAEGREVSVCGIVVDVIQPSSEIHPTRPLVLSLDDGTSEIRCVFFGFHKFEHLSNVSVGQSFLARGSVSVYRQDLQIKCETLKLVTDPNFETLWINKVIYEKRKKTLQAKKDNH